MFETFSAAAVTVPGTGDTQIVRIDVAAYKGLCFHFDVADQNLDNFDVFGRAHSAAQLIDFTPSDWANLPSGGRMRRSSGNLAAVAASGNGYFEMDVDGLAEVTILASAASDDASVTPRWSLQD